jgi:hypothetical protein
VAQVSTIYDFHLLWWLIPECNNVRHGLQIISLSFMPEKEHFSFQTHWMASMIMNQDKNNEVYSLGLVSDVSAYVMPRTKFF